MKDIVLDTDLKSLNLFKKGKVRDIYELEDKMPIPPYRNTRLSCAT